MKVFFVRHGEAMDDIEDRYGGWADLDLSPKGREGGKQVAVKLKQMNLEVDLILTSPLKRAVQTAEIIGSFLQVPVKTFVYLKERNTYGLLCGENKSEAKQKYPELVEAYEKGEEVLGYEDYQFFLKRVKVMVEKIVSLKAKTLICVTHGKLLGALFKDILGIKVKKFHDSCFTEIEIGSDRQVSLLHTDGIDLDET